MRKCFVWKGGVGWGPCLLNMSGDVSIFEAMEQCGGVSLFANETLIINV